METHGRCPMNGSSRRWPDGFRNDGSLWRLVEIACLTYLLFTIHMRYMHTTYHLLQDWLSCWVHIFLSQRLGRMRILIESDRNDIKRGVWWTLRLIGVILSETLMCDSAPTLRFVDLFFCNVGMDRIFHVSRNSCNDHQISWKHLGSVTPLRRWKEICVLTPHHCWMSPKRPSLKPNVNL